MAAEPGPRSPPNPLSPAPAGRRCGLTRLTGTAFTPARRPDAHRRLHKQRPVRHLHLHRRSLAAHRPGCSRRPARHRPLDHLNHRRHPSPARDRHRCRHHPDRRRLHQRPGPLVTVTPSDRRAARKCCRYRRQRRDRCAAGWSPRSAASGGSSRLAAPPRTAAATQALAPGPGHATPGAHRHAQHRRHLGPQRLRHGLDPGPAPVVPIQFGSSS